MAALIKPRKTERLGPGEVILGAIDVPLKAAAKVFQGGMVAIDLTVGYGVAASATLSQVVVGRYNAERAATPSLDNTSGASGALIARVEQGIFRYANSAAADAIAITEVGDICYVVDDQTVAKTDAAGTRPVAGRVMAVDSTGVYVACGLQLSSLDDVIRGSAEQVSASGALAVGKAATILAVSGTKAYTLAAGLFVGQVKRIFCKSAASTPVGVVTPVALAGFTTITFGTANTFVDLCWNGAAYDIVGVSGSVTIA